MPNTERWDAPGTLHHVFVRGLDRTPILPGTVENAKFFTFVARSFGRFGAQCIAIATVINHFHLAVLSGLVHLSRVMHHIDTSLAMYLNRLHERPGYVFQGRFGSTIVDNEFYLREIVRYVHLNPVRAGIIDFDFLAHYPWTGHAALLGNRELPFLSADYVLRHFGENKSEAQRELVAFMERGVGLRSPIEDAEEVGIERRDAGPVILGSEEFVRSTRDRIGAFVPETNVTFEELVAFVCTYRQIDPSDLMDRRKTRHVTDARAEVIYLAVTELALTHAEIAERLSISRTAVTLAYPRGHLSWMRSGAPLLPATASENPEHTPIVERRVG